MVGCLAIVQKPNMKKITKIGIGLLIFVALAFAAVYFYAFSDTVNTYDGPSVDESLIPQFKELPLGFQHRFDKEQSLPLMGSCLIDIDKDGVDELFLGGGLGQQDALFRFTGESWQDITEHQHFPQKATSTTHGAVSWDMDSDGLPDLLIAREDGIHWYRNMGGRFEARQLDIPLNSVSVPVSITLGDVDKDGDVDMFVCAYLKKQAMEGQTIFNDKSYGANSLLLLNNGSLSFRDATQTAGLEYTHNTFQAVFTDIDADGWLDLVVAYDTGEVRTYRNDGAGHFEVRPNPLSGRFAYPMGIAVGDFNNDALPDFFFSNTGTTVPHFLARGDLRDDQELVTDWLLFKNLGNFRFEDVAKATQTANFEFGWGAVFADFNLDGLQDLLVAENYVDYPLHQLVRLPGRLLLQTESGIFAATEQQAGLRNPYFCISPLVSDFNQDGYPDLIFANLNGPARALLNKGGEHRFLKVQLPNEVRSLGAAVTVETAAGHLRSDYLVVGEGLSSDQSKTLHFGLADEKAIQRVLVTYATGERDTIGYPPVNTTVVLPPKTIAAQEQLEDSAKEDSMKMAQD